MNFLKDFFQTIKNSIYSPTFYSHVSQKTPAQAIRYFFMLVVLLCIIQLLTLIPGLQSFQREIPKFINSMVQSYPKELEIKIKNQKASSNVKEPYLIAYPGNPPKGSQKNLIVIDTKTPFSEDQLAKYQADAWLTKTGVAYKTTEGIKIFNFQKEKVQNFTLNKGTVVNFVKQLSPWVPFVAPALGLVALLGMTFFYSLYMLYAFVLAGVIFFIAKILQKQRTYMDSYKTALYALTAGLLIEVFIIVTQPFLHLHSFPFMTTLVSILVVVMNLMQKDTPAAAIEALKTTAKKPKKKT